MGTKTRIYLRGWNVLKNTYQQFKKHDTPTLGAALSYYTVFSIAPILIIVVSITGALLGPHAVEGEIRKHLQSFVGADTADQLQEIVKASYQPGKNLWVTIISIVLLLIGATSAF